MNVLPARAGEVHPEDDREPRSDSACVKNGAGLPSCSHVRILEVTDSTRATTGKKLSKLDKGGEVPGYAAAPSSWRNRHTQRITTTCADISMEKCQGRKAQTVLDQCGCA